MGSDEGKNKTVLDEPRYREKPVLLLFEIYVLDIIGRLSAEKRRGVEALDLKALFKTQAGDWKDALKETLRLSPTIEIAVLDRWYSARENNVSADAEAFSQQFADDYFRDGSDVDMWPEGKLDAAKEHIEECRAKGL